MAARAKKCKPSACTILILSTLTHTEFDWVALQVMYIDYTTTKSMPRSDWSIRARSSGYCAGKPMEKSHVLECGKNTWRIRKSRAAGEWLTNSSSVLPTSRVIYQPYIITEIIFAFWLVLAYDLLEDRRTIDVIITTFFPRCFKMAESFENLDNILRDWAKERDKKILPRHWTGSKSRKKKRWSRFL